MLDSLGGSSRKQRIGRRAEVGAGCCRGGTSNCRGAAGKGAQGWSWKQDRFITEKDA